jgi:uncharacterized protein YkwD/preprotein translocase subunit Sss1
VPERLFDYLFFCYKIEIMKIKIFKIIIGLFFLFSLWWVFDIDNYDLPGEKRKVVEKGMNFQQEAPILRKEKNGEAAVRNFEGSITQIVELANQARRAGGLPELKMNELLNKSALAKASDMKDKEYFEHVSPEGIQPWFFAEQFNYKYKTFGENLAEGFFSAEEVHKAWMNSEGHRKNIMSPDFQEIGVAILDFQQNGLKSFLIVQHFGTQLTKEELEPKVVCRKEDKDACEDAEEKREEVKDAIEEQEDIIKKAKKKDAGEEAIKELEDNLDKLKQIEDEIQDYLKECEEFIDKCDRWE